MKKNIMLGVLAALAVLMTGCGKEDTAAENNQPMTSISIQKDGDIENVIVTEFSQAYYNVDGLTSMIRENIAAYQKEKAGAKIVLDTCELSRDAEDMVRVKMTYGNGEDYTGFNRKTLFAGTIQEAYESGYDLNISLKSLTDDSAEKIGRTELLSMGTNHIVILEESLRVELFDEVQYASDNVTRINKKTVDVAPSEGYSIIVFK